MNNVWETAKKPSEVKLDGVTFDVEMRDGSLYAVTLGNGSGQQVRIAKSDYSSMAMYVPAKPKMVKRWRVFGKVLGLDVNDTFENEWEATARRNALDEGLREDHEVKVEQVEVPE